MTYSKVNIVYHLQKWMDSVAGQTFLNYAYSWGASIVILGALFKLTHLPGADIMLYIGMGTEVIVFFISAFDRPFDKTTDGMNLTSQHQNTAQHAVPAQTMVQPVTGNDNTLHEAYSNHANAVNAYTERIKHLESLAEETERHMLFLSRVFKNLLQNIKDETNKIS